MRSKVLQTLFFVSLWTLGSGKPARADDSHTLEYRVKAAFLYNFTKFIEWPPETFPSPEDPIRVGVLGDEEFEEVLRESLQEKEVAGRKIVVISLPKEQAPGPVHILFLGKSERGKAGQMLRQIQRGVLTIGDFPRFAEMGGVINFILVGEKVHFEINPEAAQRGGLKISSKLLKLARIVTASS